MNALRIPLILLASAALVLSGCSASDPDSADSPSPSPTVPPGFGYRPVTAPVSNPTSAVFDDAWVRAQQASTAEFDFVDLIFTEGTPGCQVRYIDPPVTDEVSGEPVEVEGTAFLQVTCQPVTSLSPDTDRYSSPDTKNVTEVANTGYEGSTLTMTIGLQRRTPFGVVAVINEGSPPSGVSVGIMQ